MRYVLDSYVAASWYVNEPDTSKALRLRFEFLTSRHDLLAPDIFPAECANVLAKAERKGVIGPGEAAFNLDDLVFVGIPLEPSPPLLDRAIAIALSTRLTLFASLYVALAEREQCEMLTADPKLLRAARKHFPFVTALASLP